jgi:hypothetical protein
MVSTSKWIALALTHASLRGDPLRATLSGIPLVVLARGTSDWPVAPAVATLLDHVWRRAQERLCGLSDRSLLVVAEGSGQHVALDRPDLVALPIRHVMTPERVTREDLLRTSRTT